ncbi:MAG: 16S rRNA (guanine(966)-N(2))-methyltransferase RsmD [Gammaproteobacteria bacterium]|nr:16S rRNA (guanine(966)-N(2))-methyltransferase RsmD [Pseudomonadales bacterium]
MKAKYDTGSLRIIGGRWRSRKLTFPAVDQLRPTANRIRETLFNWLQNGVTGSRCLDLYAGSGACGLEALSRGAGQVTFLEKNPLAAGAIRNNLAVLGESNMPVISADVLSWLAAPGTDCQFDIVFIDPPYKANLEVASCQALESSGLLRDGSLIYLESDKELPESLFPANWRLLRSKRAGAVHYVLLERGGNISGD